MEPGIHLDRATCPIEKMGEIELLFFFTAFHFAHFLIALTNRGPGTWAQSELRSRFFAIFAKIFRLMLNGQHVIAPRQLMDSTPHIFGQEQTSSGAPDALGEQSN
jgi:hypothetical protein